MKIHNLNFKSFTNRFSLLFIVLLLSSCAAFDQHVAEVKAARAVADRDSCIAKGFKVNTDSFRLCLDNRRLERRIRSAESSATEAARSSCVAGGGTWYGELCG